MMNTPLPRLLAGELLDELHENDPRAIHSRHDLERINRVMGAAGILERALSAGATRPRRIIEFGAGDGSLMVRLARRLAPRWPNVEVVLLDRQNCIAARTREDLASTGWSVRFEQADIAAWTAQTSGERFDIALANLFIHHFDARQIGRVFQAVSARADLFVACEPRRARLPLLASHLVGLLGANEVTRMDAVLSVKAGFHRQELSSLWPAARADWQLNEYRAGLFSHVFMARRRDR